MSSMLTRSLISQSLSCSGLRRMPKLEELIASSLSARRFAVISLCLYLAAMGMQFAIANPVDGDVIAGSASISHTSTTRLDVIQSTDKAIIDWRGFSIDQGEHTNFDQPSAAAVALNRVKGSDLSSIQGKLTANGQLFLINPNGVVFGKGSQVDVGGLVATTADIRNEDFLAGRYVFDQPSNNPDASIVNKGQIINISEGGVAVLAAPGVRNEGLIKARLGQVALAGAKTFTLDFHGDGLLQFNVGSTVQEQPKDSDGKPLDSLVSNAGRIIVDGGVVALTAQGADAVVDRVINMEGVVQARAVDVRGGTIVLSGGETGIVDASGTLNASGSDVGQGGGTVKVG